MSMFRCTIPGSPVQARQRIVRKGRYAGLADVPKVREYRAYAKLVIAQNRPPAPFPGPCRAEVDIYVARPMSWPKKRVHADTKPDLDNFLKLIFDAMEGIVYTNDSRLVEVTAREHLVRRGGPRVEVTVEELQGEVTRP